MRTTFERAELGRGDAAPSVVSIGVFDGVHLGHQAILAANVCRAAELGAVPTVVTFRDHPKRVLLGRAPRTLTTLEHRLQLFQRAGIEHTLALQFDADLRRVSAEDFTRELLVAELGAKSFVLGFDSKFGRDREGGPEFLMELGFDVQVVPEVDVDRRAVSSTAIREAVELGDLAGAARMLGRAVSVFGEVVRGDALGRQIGFPTANLDLHHELHPPTGVYACLARRRNPADRSELPAAHPAVANIGYRPTVAGTRPERPLVEVHLLDFEGDLYGEHLELEFVACLRGEVRFDGLEALGEQIARDVADARRVLARESGPSL
ncbi:MAG: bifunctional riboflavin kinase/FAD synthetase [Planctomycetota bacterium]|nr:MAG: bifunctional riboflavin kinase/FAD synthetase [Planctomycetota bacterium]